MSSVISKDDIADELVKAGVKSPHVRERLLRIINIYALTVARGYAVPEAPSWLPPPGDRYPHLHPGEPDLTEEVTRCLVCMKPKKWRLFHVDKDSRSGHKTTCKACVKIDRKPPAAP